MSTPRVAIACPGVGRVQRGFERLFRDIFDETLQEIDIVLFKGGGKRSDREIVPLFLPRGGAFLKYLPIHKLFGRTAMHVECVTFALAILPALLRRKIDVVHVIDPPLAKVLFILRERLGLKFRVLYTEGTAMPPGDYPPCDHIHQISAATLEEAAEYGHIRERMSLIPCGVRPEAFQSPEDKSALRTRYGVGNDFVILSVAALNRGHKRSHYLIDEVASTDLPVLLWMDGSLDHGEPDLVDYAKARLGERVRITHVRTAEIGNLYRLADLFVHAAGFEAFGLAIVEAATLGLPLIIHDNEHFRWLVPNEACRIDMKEDGALARKLEAVVTDAAAREGMAVTEFALATYAWEALRPRYAALYRQVAG